MDIGEHNYWAQLRASAALRGIKWEAITTNDTIPLNHQYKAVLCVTAGNAVMKDTAGTSLTLAMAAATLLPVVPTIMTTASTGTYVGIIE